MACPEPTSGCSINPDGVPCGTPKTLGTFDRIVIVNMVGQADSITMNIETSTSYPDQTIKCLAKVKDGKFTKRTFAARDQGSIDTPDIFDRGDEVEIFLRPETSTEYGEWRKITGFAIDGWMEAVDAISYKGEIVTYGGEIVTYLNGG